MLFARVRSASERLSDARTDAYDLLGCACVYADRDGCSELFMEAETQAVDRCRTSRVVMTMCVCVCHHCVRMYSAPSRKVKRSVDRTDDADERDDTSTHDDDESSSQHDMAPPQPLRRRRPETSASGVVPV
jgi:hypothetical protein